MIVFGLLAAGASFRRLVALRNLALAAGAGLLAGLALLGLPAPELVRPAYVVLVCALGGALVLPLAASIPAGDRACGYEQLVGARPIASPALALGRVLGTLVGAAFLFLVLTECAQAVAAGRAVPEELVGSLASSPGELPEWRFPVPRGAQGPFQLELAVHVPLRRTAQLTVDARRGEGRQRLLQSVPAARRVELSIPDLAPARGDLYLRLVPGPGLVLGSAPPRLVVGLLPLGASALSLPQSARLRLLLATLAAVAAACAFHFETALLAALLAALLPVGENSLGSLATAVLLLVFSIIGTALVRRQSLP